ncbi:hypothetical protein C1J01_38620 [Nonomuraea aridisoli]|uniref:Uncharacterized protein n=1 Tax=Nonomuraea aridisoli TaxID=2070368 RepID=A0A2W2DWV0_9ACTN|nr:hypothetical protein C1J01_38620 [Nonomuraea aridisoli]
MLVAVASGLCVVVLGGAILWLTPTTPTSMTAKLAVVDDAPPATPQAGPTRTATRTAPPSPQTDGTPSTIADDGTGGDTPADGAVGGFAIANVRPAGTRDGVCWAGGKVTLRALVRRTGEATSFDYTWVVDGADVARSTALIAENGRRHLAAPRPLRSTGGSHSVTLRITAPIALQRTITITMCDQAAY